MALFEPRNPTGPSLAGSAVKGAIAGEAAAGYSGALDTPAIPDARIAEIVTEILAPLRRDAGYGPVWVTQTLQAGMIPDFVLYIKKGTMMQAALAYVEELRDHHAPMLRAANMHELRLAFGTRNRMLSAEMKLRAALLRTESRCGHYRLDCPDVDDVNWRAWINIVRGDDGMMQLEKQPLDRWPAEGGQRPFSVGRCRRNHPLMAVPGDRLSCRLICINDLRTVLCVNAPERGCRQGGYGLGPA